MTNHPILPTVLGILLSIGLLSLGVSSAEAEGDAKSDGGDHGGGESGDGDATDPNALPEFDGPPPPLPWEIPRATENSCSKEEIVVLRELRERSEQLELRSDALDERERAIEQAEQLHELLLQRVRGGAEVGVELGARGVPQRPRERGPGPEQPPPQPSRLHPRRAALDDRVGHPGEAPPPLIQHDAPVAVGGFEEAADDAQAVDDSRRRGRRQDRRRSGRQHQVGPRQKERVLDLSAAGTTLG